MDEKKEKYDFMEGKKFTSYASPFLNTDALFVEFNDVLSSPFFLFIYSIHENKEINTLLDFDKFHEMTVDEIYEWYVNRKHINPLLDIKLREGSLEEYFNNDYKNYMEWSRAFLYSELDELSTLSEFDSELNFAHSLDLAAPQSMIKRSFVYSEVYNKSIEDWIYKRYGDIVLYVYGDLGKVIEENNITSNSTFVFSDITKINKLKDINKLDYSSILLADRYRYNYDKDNKNYIIDINELYKDHIFKFDCFDDINNIEVVKGESQE